MKSKELNVDAEQLNDIIVASVPYGKEQLVSQATFYRWQNEGVKPLNRVKEILDSLGFEIKEIKLFIKKDS